MTPILTKIEAGMASYISNMRKSAGYYYDWGSVNEPDIAKQEFPSAEIMVTDETCEDEEDGVWAGGYNQHATILIRVRVALENEETTPSYAVNKDLTQAIEDLKRLFGQHYTVSDACDTIMYTGSVRVPDKSNDILRPAYADTTWLVKYVQDRKRPDLMSN